MHLVQMSKENSSFSPTILVGAAAGGVACGEFFIISSGCQSVALMEHVMAKLMQNYHNNIWSDI